jgi:phosphoribosylformylglycinamidine synthase
MVGVIERQEYITTLDFKAPGHPIILLGHQHEDIGSSQYLAKYHRVAYSPCPEFHLDHEFALQQAVKQMIRSATIQSCHDISEGGLFISLMESAKAGNLGFRIHSNPVIRKDAWLFGESQSRVVVTVSCEEDLALIEQIAEMHGVPCTVIGRTIPERLVVDDEDWGEANDFAAVYDSAIEKRLESH